MRCRICCRIKLSKDDFYFRKDSGTLRTECKLCVRAMSALWHSRNRDQSLKNKKDWGARSRPSQLPSRKIWVAKNRDKLNEYHRARREDPERGEYVRAWFREYLKSWRARNPDKVGLRNAISRGKSHRIPLWSDISKIKSLYALAKAKGLTVDHIVPLQSKLVSGLHCEHNLQLLTQVENTRKGNKHWPDMPQ